MGEKTKNIIGVILGLALGAAGIWLFLDGGTTLKTLTFLGPISEYATMISKFAWILTVIGVAILVKYGMELHRIIKESKEEMIFYGGDDPEYKKKVVKAMQYKVEERRSDNVSICAHCGVRLEDFPKKCPNCGKKQ